MKTSLSSSLHVSFSAEVIFTFYTLISGLIHVGIFALSIMLGVWPVTIYEIFPIVWYFFCYSKKVKAMNTPMYTVSVLEVIINSILCTYFLGWSYGFHLYLFSIPLKTYFISYHMRVRKLGKLPPLLYSIPSFITAVVLRSFSVKWTLDGKVANAAIQGIVYDINFTLCFIAVIFLLVAFCASIEEMESELERKNALLADSAADLEEKNEDLRLSATTDYLTGVLNRRSIMPYFSQMKEQYEHLQIPFCAVLGDIDDFKKINDVYGHNAGDDVLIALTTTISDNMRNGDCICRWGGEEFLILLSQCDLNNAKTTMERIRDNIHKQRVTSENCEIVCTMTFGIETYRGQEFDQLTDQADAKLYYGKKHGKNQVVAQVPKQAC